MTICCRHYFNLVAFCLMAGNIQAQLTIDGKPQYEIRCRVQQAIEEFQNVLSDIVNNNLRQDIRTESVVNLLKLFIGEGDPYDYYDYDADTRIHSSGVKIRTSSIYKTNDQSQKLKRYIYRLYNPETGKTTLSYTKMVIEAVDYVFVDNIEKVGDHFECIAFYNQKCKYYHDRKVIYSDCTMNKIKLTILAPVTLPNGKTILPVKLGDLYVVTNQKK